MLERLVADLGDYEMKLAEALLLRADLQKKLARLRDRIVGNVLTQQGDKPHESPEKLVREARSVIAELEQLVVRINRTNAKYKMRGGGTLMESIAARDGLKLQHALLESTIAGTKKEPDRYSAREIKWVVQVDIAKLQKEVESAAKRIREINAEIQETNWKAELED
ncbi:MAG: DIP1984 family protein [Phycisphaeraceae bacterium]|nr:DIP1984 family protein [Phycisphaeraceae bacterium]